jgi:Ni2+-binding GTPase involved in maturation of urease and hydrogenase
MNTIRFIMAGGFLGAGKTTTLGRLARHYMERGQRVGLITNDQAADLVDTHSLREQGFAVEEVAGACFCCRFDELLERAGALESAQRPDVILAEPVGSCTDLVATVVQPLKDLYGSRFSIAPYAVVFKPSHGLKILRGESGGGFSPKAAYIFRKQLEEADAILVNRIDELSPAQLDEIGRLVNEQYPGTPVLRVSARTGAGFEALTQLLDQEGGFGQKILDIDYDIYAAGEAELGWLNSSLRVEAPQPFALDELLLEVVQGLEESLRASGAEVAHLKAIGLCENSFAVANLVSSGGRAELSLPSRCTPTEADIVVNARVAIDPELLRAQVAAIVQRACAARGATPGGAKTQSFRPGRPQPTHRYART